MHFSKPVLGTPLNFEHPLNKDLALHLAVNEGHGDKVQDLSLNGNHGTLHNFTFPPTVDSGWNPGQTGVGLNFDGTNNYITIPDSDSLDADDSMTVSIFTKFSTQSGDKMFLYKDGFATGWYLRTNVGGIIIPKIDDGVNDRYANSPTRYDDGIWHHICMVVEDRLLLILYVDGNKVSEGNASAVGSISNNSDLTIGKQTGAASNIDGSIDQPRIQNRAWSAKEVMDYTINPWQVYLDEDD